MKKEILRRLENIGFKLINKFCYSDFFNIENWYLQKEGCYEECNHSINKLLNKIDFLSLDYENNQGVFNLDLTKLDDLEFFYIGFDKFEEFPKTEEEFNILKDEMWWKKYYIQSTKIVLGIDFHNKEKPEHFLSIPFWLKFYFKTKVEYLNFKKKLNDLITSTLPFLNSKEFNEYLDPIFKFKKEYNEYSSPLFEENKKYLGEEVEKDLVKSIERGFSKKDEDILPYYEIETFESYDVIVQKLKKYKAKKITWNSLQIKDFVFKINRDNKSLEEDCFKIWKRKESWYFTVINNFEKDFIELMQPTGLSCCDDCCGSDIGGRTKEKFNYKNIEKIEVYILNSKKYGLHQELWNRIKFFTFCIPFNKNRGDIYPRVTQNFILMMKEKNRIYYTIRVSDFYNYFYAGKYLPLKNKYLKKIVKAEKDIFGIKDDDLR